MNVALWMESGWGRGCSKTHWMSSMASVSEVLPERHISATVPRLQAVLRLEQSEFHNDYLMIQWAFMLGQ